MRFEARSHAGRDSDSADGWKRMLNALYLLAVVLARTVAIHSRERLQRDLPIAERRAKVELRLKISVPGGMRRRSGCGLWCNGASQGRDSRVPAPSRTGNCVVEV